MALRLSVYVQLFWQQLIKGKQLTASSKLPPVFPLVLYNGDQRGCANSVAQLIDLPLESSLWCYQPEMQYYIISEQQCAQRLGSTDQIQSSGTKANIKKQKDGPDNVSVEEVVSSPLVSLLFRLEGCKTVLQLHQLIESLAELMRLPEYQGVKRDVAAWLKQVRLPGFESDLNKHDRIQYRAGKNDLNLGQFSEVKNILADRIKQWEVELIEQGIEKGVEKGKEQGIREGSSAARHAMQGTLVQLLNQKFEILSAETIKTIESYGIERLEVCLGRILTASSVAEVLEN